MGVVAARQIGLGNRLGAADAFGYVLAGKLEMNAAGMGALGPMDSEEAVHLVEDFVEMAGFVAIAAFDRIAVHGIARPDDPAV